MQNRRIRINLPDNHHNREDKRCRAYVFDNLLKPSRPCINLGTQNAKDSFGFFTVHVTGREKEMTNKQKTQTQQMNNTLIEYSPPLFTNRQNVPRLQIYFSCLTISRKQPVSSELK